MVQESESRFSSDQQTILQTLDPIHRSLLLNNSEFESINSNTINKFNQFPTSTGEVLQQQQQLLHLQQQQTQQEKQHPNNSIENKHFYDTSYLGKPDATCVSDSNCVTLFHEEFNMPDELECSAPSNDKQPTVNERQPRKHIRIRIVTNIRRPCGYSAIEEVPSERTSVSYSPKQRWSSESQTDSSSYEHVDTDSEIEVSSGGAEEHTENSGGNTNTDEFSDYTDSNNYGSSSNDETSSTSSHSASTAPMIQITQQITEQRTVVSMVHVNKQKVKSFQKSREDRSTVMSIGRPKWINKQKIIDDNVCNEILDETINSNVMEGETQKNLLETAPVTDTIIYGKLEGKPKPYHPNCGKLLKRRLARQRSDDVHFPTYQKTQSVSDVPSTFQPIRNVPPAKPPRTFASSSSKASSDSIGANTATTLPIGDHKSLPSQHSSQMSPGGGWAFDKTLRSTTKPTCPTLDDINDFEHPKKIGWVPSIAKCDEFLQVLHMLNDDRTMTSKITSSNLTPEPQFQIPCKEDIDQVDSYTPPKPAPRRSKQMSIELNDSICNSTPVKRPNQFSSHSVPNSTRNEMDFCKNCKLQIMEPPSSARKSFGKGAIKRTKQFFQASRNILGKSRPKPTKPYENCTENEFSADLDDNVDETPRKLRLNTTVDFNTNDTVRFEKKMEKSLDLTPKQSESTNNIDGPRRILDKLLTSVKRTPPKKPIRQSLAHKDIARSPSNNEEENFNFDRIVDSPKPKEREKSFRLSPRKLLFSANERPIKMQHNSYRSYEVDEDDLKQCMVEYLRSMNKHIEHKQGELECVSVPRWRSRVRNFSTSSDATDYVPQHQRVVEIDCHPEPIYSEIVAKPPTTVLNHIIVNGNPKAIYTTVNKARNRNVVTPITVDVDGIHAETEEADYSRWNSLEKLPIHNNFADSVLNMLSLMKGHNLHKDSQIRDVVDLKTQQNASEVTGSYVVEPTVVPLTSEQFQKSPLKANYEAVDDDISMETFFTESLCEDVIRGDSVNKNIVKDIVSACQHKVSEIALAESETDDEIDLHCMTDEKMDSKGDSVEYCSILDGNASNSPVIVNAPTSNRRRRSLQSPLVAAPSMIEIPDQFMLKLTSQIVAQREIRNQLKQAIHVCRTTKEFECSPELIEAERLMLLSAKKETYAKLELNRIDYEENGLTASPAKCVGTVTLKNIEFDLKPEEMLEQIFQLSYICVCSYRNQVVATHPQERNGSTVRFEDISLKIGSLNSSFEIKIEIFVLRLTRPMRKYSHESKYHLNKIPKKSLFSNTVKLFTNATASTSKTINQSEESRFRLRGVSTISANCLSSEKFEIVRNVSWPRTHVYISYNTKALNLKINDQFSNMTGALRTEFICEVDLRDTGLAGHLYIEEGIATKREMWCRLVGCTIECWSNDIDCLNGKVPILSIDIVKSTNELFELIDHKVEVDIFHNEIADRADKNRLKRYWLSANNQNDLILWLTDLNRILKFIRDWNIY
ncbi:uncharacterized protein LOC119080960 isoform X2 [Bradysia coprophila]|nr:uncharacterized protein LOC119080960 isoform X2 [Bradysia coprophila]